ncbi:MAG: argininosuccinate lyase [Actinobacteria bacterium]|nr:argininosuccinate lyase [Actinomycetota bacterium]
MADKLWKGRISKDPDTTTEKFTSSINIDRDLYLYDITGTAAYAIGLENIGIISGSELKEVLAGLKEIKIKIENGKIEPGNYEDIHSLVEYELGKIIGETAGKIHTGRSRNDQIVVDELLFLKDAVIESIKRVIDLEKVILTSAELNSDLIFPAYTHMQKAQPVLVSHYLLSFYEKFLRNINKLFECFEDCDFMPLGAAACAGSGYDINIQLLTQILKFKKAGSNSMDIVGSRDYFLDFIYCCSSLMINLSRFSEDLIIYNTNEFFFIDIDDAFCTGSSIMPQKKNPDILELVRGKCSLVVGNLMQLMMLLKGLPSTYNSDMQEDKKITFSAYEETRTSLAVFAKLLKNISFKRKTIEKSLKSGFIEATDAADYLVKKGLSFRKSHNITGKLVKYCIENNISLTDVSVEKLKEFSKNFDNDFYTAIKIENCIDAKVTPCGTNKKNVLGKIKSNKKIIENLEKKLADLVGRIPIFDEIIAQYLK